MGPQDAAGKYKNLYNSVAKVIHVDIDRTEIGRTFMKPTIGIVANLLDFLRAVNRKNIHISIDKWLCTIQNWKQKYGDTVCRAKKLVDPVLLVREVSRYASEDTIFTSDVGANQMWVAQTIQLKKGMKYFTSGGLAPMGYAMPTAIGCAFASPEKNVIAVCGDGAFHMSTQSLGVISQYNLPIKVVIMNNNCLGMINQFQRLYFDSRFYGTHPTCGYKNPSYEEMARAYGLTYFKITSDDLKDSNLMMSIFKTKTCVIEYVIEGLTSVCPKLEYDKPLSKPAPMLDEVEFNKAFSIFN